MAHQLVDTGTQLFLLMVHGELRKDITKETSEILK